VDYGPVGHSSQAYQVGLNVTFVIADRFEYWDREVMADWERVLFAALAVVIALTACFPFRVELRDAWERVDAAAG